jgi:hypothetical protein
MLPPKNASLTLHFHGLPYGLSSLTNTVEDLWSSWQLQVVGRDLKAMHHVLSCPSIFHHPRMNKGVGILVGLKEAFPKAHFVRSHLAH